jgi:hypothetical protein
MRRQRARRRGETCEHCSDRLNGQGVIVLDGTRRLYLCRVCTEAAWARHDAAEDAQREILEHVWRLAPGDVDRGLGAA